MNIELRRLVIGVREWALERALVPERTTDEVLEAAQKYEQYVSEGILDKDQQEKI